MLAARHEDREDDESRDPEGEGDPGDRIRPLALLAADEPEREAADGDRGDERADPVEMP